jgi:hypothetical protein
MERPVKGQYDDAVAKEPEVSEQDCVTSIEVDAGCGDRDDSSLYESSSAMACCRRCR